MQFFIDEIEQNINASIVDFQVDFEDNILKIKKNIFNQIVLLSINDFKSFFDYTPQEKRDFLSNLLNFNYIDKLEENLKEMDKKFNNKRCEYEIKREYALNEYNNLEKSVYMLYNELKEEDSNKNTRLIEKLEIDINLLDYLKDYDKKEIQKKIEINEHDINEYNSIIDENKNKIEIFNKTINELEKEKLKIEYKQCDINKCPIVNNNLVSKEQFDELNDNLKREEQKKIFLLNEKIDKNIELKEIENKSLVLTQNFLKKEIDKKYKNEQILKDFDKIEQLKQTKESLMKVQKTQNNIKELYDKTNEDYIKSGENVNNISRKIRKIDSYFKYFDILKKEYFGDKGIKLKIFIRKIIPILNKLLYQYLIKLEGNFEFKFDNELKNIIKINGNEIDFESLSSGQQLKLKMSLVFAFKELIELTQTNSRFNLFLIDELLDSSMDNDSVDNCINIIREKTISENLSSFIITHNQDIKEKGFFDNIYNIEQKDNFSFINKEY